jgi:hypothetical protein
MRLYHFLSTEFAFEDLRNRRLKIAEYSDLNDPFELVAAHNEDSTQREILRRWKDDFREKRGVLCFCKTWRNPVMWSHYSDKHQGICLGFDVDDEFAIPIRYSNKRLDMDFVGPNAAANLNQDMMLRLLQTKYSDWGYEREVRLSVELDTKDSETGFYYYEFDERVRLAEVIAGPSCPVTESEVKELLSATDTPVDIFKARLAFKSFKVVRDQRGFRKQNDS